MSDEPLRAYLLELCRFHDGDDRCGCLRDALLLGLDGDLEGAVEVVEDCLAEHPCGRRVPPPSASLMRSHCDRSSDSQMPRTDGRTDGLTKKTKTNVTT